MGLLRALWDDDGNLAQELFARNGARVDARSAFARGLLRAANGAYGPMAMLAAFREFADRIDGRPKQATETRQQRVTIITGEDPPEGDGPAQCPPCDSRGHIAHRADAGA